MVSPFPDCKVPLFITSIASKILSISFFLILFLVLLLFVMKVLLLLLLLEVLPGVNCESLIVSFSLLLFSFYESIFFLCALLLELDERDYFPSFTDSLNE